jgi:predicted dehydrogenase
LLGVVKAYRSFEEVLEDAELHAVHIGVPNRLHYEMAAAALEAGKHVMCEKPLAMTSDETTRLVELARQHPHQAAGVNYNCRFYPLCLEARDIIRRGDLGEVFHVCGSYAQDWLMLPTDYNWRVLTDEGGELRAVADIGTHWLDLVYSITGLEIEEVCADLRTVHPIRQRPKGEIETFKSKEQSHADIEPVNISTDDYGSVMLRFVGGARGCVWVSQVTAGRKNCQRLEIAGSKQSIAWNSEQPNEMWRGYRNRSNEILIRDPALLGVEARAAIDWPGGHNEGHADTFKQCFRAFYQYIAAGDFSAPATFPTFDDGHREALLCEAILASQKQCRWTSVPNCR